MSYVFPFSPKNWLHRGFLQGLRDTHAKALEHHCCSHVLCWYYSYIQIFEVRGKKKRSTILDIFHHRSQVSFYVPCKPFLFCSLPEVVILIWPKSLELFCQITQDKKMYMWDLRSYLPGYQSLWWVCDHSLHCNWLFACIIHFVFSFQYIIACFQFSTMESSNKFMHFKVGSINLNFARKIKVILYIFMFSKESWLTHHNNPQSSCLISFSYINKI